ncbi:MAG: nuclear transport factor 2 family protein [Saprospiraceae bacterium]|nr:nuclear transport factor 2 family protein [Saprospiraceae bacterium]
MQAVQEGALEKLKSITMELSNREKAVALIESLETGAREPAGYINPHKYIQHNLAVADGIEGFAQVLAHAPEGGFKARVVRSFEDGDYVVLHTEYDFFGPKVGFDIFRFEQGLIVEHWDNLADIAPPNPSGRTQLDGAAQVADPEKTEDNKKVVRQFVSEVLLEGNSNQITDYVNADLYLQHNTNVADGLDGLGAALQYFAENGLVMEYDKVHMVLGEGNFVLTVSEGKFGQGDHVAYYDLFRLEDGKIVEHWDVIQPIPVASEWKNSNGKF